MLATALYGPNVGIEVVPSKKGGWRFVLSRDRCFGELTAKKDLGSWFLEALTLFGLFETDFIYLDDSEVVYRLKTVQTLILLFTTRNKPSLELEAVCTEIKQVLFIFESKDI